MACSSAAGRAPVVARVVANKLSDRLGQTVVVENAPGAGGVTGTQRAARAEPDGYTLLFGSSATLAIGPALYGNSGYDPVKSFAPIAMVIYAPQINRFIWILEYWAPNKDSSDPNDGSSTISRTHEIPFGAIRWT